MATFDLASANGVVWRVTFPGFETTRAAERPSMLTLAGITASDRGIGWIEFDGSSATLAVLGDDDQLSFDIPDPLYGLRNTQIGFLGIEDSHSPNRIIRVVEGPTGARFEDVVPPAARIGSFDVDRGGTLLAVERDEGPGTPTWIDVWRDGQLAQTIRPSGRLVGNVRLDPAGDALYLEDHDLGVLRRIELGSGAESIVLRADVSEPAISPSGSLVAYTLVSETDRLCVAPLPAAGAREP